MIDRKFGISDALESIAPGAAWAYEGDDVSTLEWFDENVERPTDDQISSEVDRLQKEFDALRYQRLRMAEYPDFREYLDGVVKGDNHQIQMYIAGCLAVKEKYPKPEAPPEIQMISAP